MKNIFIKLLALSICFFFMCGFTYNEEKVRGKREINPFYLEYEKLSDEDKAKVSVIPQKYIIYEELDSELSFNNKSKSSRISGAVPTSYDLKNVNGNNYAPDVDDQSSFSLCWAFAMNNIVESNIKRLGLGNTNLSENHVDYVINALNPEKKAGEGWYRKNVAEEVWLNGFGPVSETKFGEYDDTFYCSSDGSTVCTTEQKNNHEQVYIDRDVSDYLSSNNLDYDVTNVKYFPSVNIVNELSKVGNNYSTLKTKIYSYNEKIKQYIMDNGAIMASFLMATDYYNGSENYFYYNATDGFTRYSSTYHSITIIGWDDTKGPDVTGDGIADGAWYIQNSWGDSYTYFYVSYFDRAIVQEMIGVSGTIEKDWDNIYLYDYGEITNASPKPYKKINYNIRSYDNMEEYYETANMLKILYGNIDEPLVDVSLSAGGDTISIKDVKLEYGINSVNLNNFQLYGNEITLKIYAEDSYTLDNMRPNLYTSNTEDTVIVEPLGNETISFSGSANETKDMLLVTKNVNTGTDYSVKIYDDNYKNITNLFNITKNELINGIGQITVKTIEEIPETNSVYICTSTSSSSEYCTNALILRLKGHGTLESPYLIEYPSQLIVMDERTEYFKLANDIDMKSITSKVGPYSENWFSINFYGVFDGDGYTISNIKSSVGGLFYYLSGATVKNLKLDYFDIGTEDTSVIYGGVLTNNCNGCIINNVWVDHSDIKVSVDGGGLVGDIFGTTSITDNKVSNTKITSNIGGGIVGYVQYYSYDEKVINTLNIKKNIIENVTFVGEEGRSSIGNICGAIEYDIIEGSTQSTINILNNYYDNDAYSEVSEISRYALNGNGYFEIVETGGNINVTGNTLVSSDNKYLQSTYPNLDFTNNWEVQTESMPNLKVFSKSEDLPSLEIHWTSSFDEDKVAYNIPKEISVDDFDSQLSLADGVTYRIFDMYGYLKTDGKIGTGCTLQVLNDKTSKTLMLIVPGDVNGDGYVDVSDVKMTADFSLQRVNLYNIFKIDAQNIAANVNYDNSIDVSDVKKMADYSLNNLININKEME